MATTEAPALVTDENEVVAGTYVYATLSRNRQKQLSQLRLHDNSYTKLPLLASKFASLPTASWHP